MNIIKFTLLVILLPAATIYLTLTFKEMSNKQHSNKLDKNKPSKIISLEELEENSVPSYKYNFHDDDDDDNFEDEIRNELTKKDNLESTVQSDEENFQIEEFDYEGNDDKPNLSPKIVTIVQPKAKIKSQKTKPTLLETRSSREKATLKTTKKKTTSIKKVTVVNTSTKLKPKPKAKPRLKVKLKAKPRKLTTRSTAKTKSKFKKQTIRKKPKTIKKTSLTKAPPIIQSDYLENESSSDYEDEEIIDSNSKLDSTEKTETTTKKDTKEFSSDPCSGRSARYIARCRHR